MKRTKSVTLIATGLILGLLPIWTVVEGRTSAASDSGRSSFASPQAARSERAAQRRERAAELREKARAAQREQIRQMRAEGPAIGAVQQEHGWSSPGEGLTPYFEAANRSLSIDGDFDLGPMSNISKDGDPWLWTDGAGNLGAGLLALASTTSGIYNTAVGYYTLYANTEGSNNDALGANALRQNQDGNWNIAVGTSALRDNTSGSFNHAFGHYALRYNTTGSNNVAVGNTALRYTDGNSIPTYGSFNTAVGDGSLSSNTIGLSNVAVGMTALFSNEDASFLTAVGRSALESNTTIGVDRGFGNSAFGSFALQSNTTGIFNTATGSKALQENVTGSENTATGYGALQNNTDVAGPSETYSGGSNSAFGVDALLNNTHGSQNTAVGAQALKNNMTGNYNTALGFFALESSAGSFNIAVGADAGSAAVGSSNIFIGNFGTSGDNYTIRIGNQASGMPDPGQHNRAFLAGVYDAIVAGEPVCVDSNAQLGECPPPGPLSSSRFKREIRDMGEVSQKLSELRPVTFRFKEEFERGSPGVQFGLIAEEVAEVFQQLVQYDEEGKPYSVKYELLTPLLLNELQRQQRLVRAQGEEIALLREQAQLLAHQNLELAFLRTRLDRLEAGHQLSSRPEATGHPTVSFTQSGREPPDAGGG